MAHVCCGKARSNFHSENFGHLTLILDHKNLCKIDNPQKAVAAHAVAAHGVAAHGVAAHVDSPPVELGQYLVWVVPVVEMVGSLEAETMP